MLLDVKSLARLVTLRASKISLSVALGLIRVKYSLILRGKVSGLFEM